MLDYNIKYIIKSQTVHENGILNGSDKLHIFKAFTNNDIHSFQLHKAVMCIAQWRKYLNPKLNFMRGVIYRIALFL